MHKLIEKSCASSLKLFTKFFQIKSSLEHQNELLKNGR